MGLRLFDAYDREHAAMITAGLSTRWPEESEEEEQWIESEFKSIMESKRNG